MSTTREQVKAAIIDVIGAAEAQGQSGVDAARSAFPGAPETVLWECWAEHDHAATEAWWQSVERIIEGEMIRNALQKPEDQR